MKGFPSRYIYEPWNAPESVQKAAKCIIGVDYPRPIVNHAETSRLNIERMKQIYQQLSRYRGLCKEPLLSLAFHSPRGGLNLKAFSGVCWPQAGLSEHLWGVGKQWRLCPGPALLIPLFLMTCSPHNLVYILTTPCFTPQVCWHLSLPVWKTSVTLLQSPVLARLGALATWVSSYANLWLPWPSVFYATTASVIQS